MWCGLGRCLSLRLQFLTFLLALSAQPGPTAPGPWKLSVALGLALLPSAWPVLPPHSADLAPSPFHVISWGPLWLRYLSSTDPCYCFILLIGRSTTWHNMYLGFCLFVCLVTALLSYNSQTIQFTHLTCTIHRFSVCAELWAVTTIHFRTFSSPQKPSLPKPPLQPPPFLTSPGKH